MKTFLAGKDVSIDVLFQQGADTVVPDTGSVKYTLYDNSGVALQSDVPISTGPDDTSVSLPILATYNGIGSDNFQYRTLVVDFKVAGGSREIQVQYRLVKFVMLPVSNDDVRSLVGFSLTELPDSDIDLLTSYFEVADDVGQSELDIALRAKGITTLSAQRLIICQALIDLLPGLQFRVLQLAKSNTSQFERISKLDFGELEDWLYGLYADAFEVIIPPDPGDPNAGNIFLVSTQTTDPITAAAPAV